MLLFCTGGDDVMCKGGLELIEGIIAHCYFWYLSKCSTWAPTHTTSTQTCSGCPVLTHWDSNIVPPPEDGVWLGRQTAADMQAPSGTRKHRSQRETMWVRMWHLGGPGNLLCHEGMASSQRELGVAASFLYSEGLHSVQSRDRGGHRLSGASCNPH